MPLLFRELFCTRTGAFFGLDVLLSAIVLVVFIRRDGARLGMRMLWVPVVATCLIGVSCGLPLFLYLRERRLANCGSRGAQLHS
jgi:predicted exporter